MDIRTRLIFALVATALLSMLALGAFAYVAARDLQVRSALLRLDAVAESKKARLEEVIVAWRDRVLLVVGRADLAEPLAEWRRRRSDGSREQIEEVLEETLRSGRAMLGISIHSADGFPLTARGVVPGSSERVRPAAFLWADEPVLYRNVSQHDEEGLIVTLMAPIRHEGSLVGAAQVALSARELIVISADDTGLGATGETLLALATEHGGAQVLHSLRHAADGEGRSIAADAEMDPVLRAVRGEEGVIRDGAIDYRGEAVWASTRHLEEFGWGLVVKTDVAEELAPVHELRTTMVRLGLSLSAFAIIAGTLLGFFFARPIRELAEVARRVRRGELDARAPANSEDEVGLLGQLFNEMTQEFVRTHRELERRIRERS